MFNYNKVLTTFATLLCITGCSTASGNYSPALLHFSTPETSGGWGNGSVDFSIASTPEYSLGGLTSGAITASSTPQSVTEHEIQMKLNAWVGLLNNIDFYMDVNGVLGGKLQLLGSSRSAKETGAKLAVEARLGSRTSSESLGRSSPANVDITDYSLNFGYRFTPSVLAYLNTFKSKNNVSYYSYTTVGGGGVSSYTFEATSHSQGLLLGVNISPKKHVSIILEAGATKVDWENFETVTAYPFGISLGYYW